MEHWDHRTCEAITSLSTGTATVISTVIALFIAGAIGFGFI